MNLGLLDKERGRPDAARRQQEQAQAIRRQLLEGRRHAAEVEQLVRRDLALGHYNLANLALERGDGPAARENFNQAITLLEDVLRSAPQDLANQHRLGVCYRLLADLLCDSDPQAALVRYEQAQQRLEPLARANPNVPQYQSALACVYLNLGGMHLQEQQAGPARDALDKARSMLEPLVVATQGDPQCRRDLAVTLGALARLYIFAGKQADARSKLESAWRSLRELAAAFPDTRDYAERLADVEAALAELEKPQGRP